MLHISNVAQTWVCFLWALQCVEIVTGQQTAFRVPIHNTQILDEDFSTWIEETGKEWGMKGIAIAVVRRNDESGDWVTETKGYGVADRWGNGVDKETLFNIGSNSKLFTALAIGMIAENASIAFTWDSKIKDVVSRSVWHLQDNIAEENANIVDILSHRTGLPRHDLSNSIGDTMETTLSKLRHMRPSAEFRDVYQYNNQMYYLAAHIVSRMANTSFVDFVSQKIISPLGLTSTTYNLTLAAESGKLADGFLEVGKDTTLGKGRVKMQFRPIPYSSLEGGMNAIAGPGGVMSSVGDLTIWLQSLLLLGRSPTTGKQVIPATVVDRVSQGVTVANPVAQTPELSPTVYGMGQSRCTYQGHELIEHGGAVMGHYSSITRAPNDGIGIAILTNWDYGGIFMNVIKYHLLEKMLGLPEVNWNERLHKPFATQGLRTHSNEISFQPLTPTMLSSKLKYSPVTHASGNMYTKSSFGHAVEGIYFNPAYGTLALCVYPRLSAPRVPRQECAEQFPEELRPLVNSSDPILLAVWPKIWSSHIILRQEYGYRFVSLPVYIFPAPFPPDDKDHDEDEKRPFAVSLGVQWPAQFVTITDETEYTRIAGMAWTGMWGAGIGVDSPKGEGKEGAEVWFDRVA